LQQSNKNLSRRWQTQLTSYAACMKTKLHILNWNHHTKNTVVDDKHKPQAKLPVLNWHNQNPHITTVEMLNSVATVTV
jgi:hypothetical protein